MSSTRLRDELIDIVGTEYLSDDPTILEKYSRDQSFVPPRKPDYVMHPKSVEEVQQIVKIANKYIMPIIPYSSGYNFHGATIPDHGGIVLNLSRMNKILEVDEKNWFVVIEPGVTFQDLQNKLEKYGLRVMIPFGVPPKKSALSSYVERIPALAAASFEYGNDHMLDSEIVLPDGDLFRTGKWSGGGRPGHPWGPVMSKVCNLWTGAQGTLGIFTKLVVKVEHLPKIRKLLFLPFDSLEELIEPVKRIQRREIGLECFALNRFNLAALTDEDWTIPDYFPSEKVFSDKFENLRTDLPSWTLIVCLSSFPLFPEEKIAYEEEALREVCSELNIEPLSTIPGLLELEKIILEELMRPWGILKKFHYKGSVHDLSFKSPLKRVLEFEGIIHELADKHGYPLKDIGGYLLPIERGRAVHLEFDLHCDLTDPEGTERVRELWYKASESLIDKRAFFDRPYGPWAEMVYSRAGTYTQKLRELKKEMDPRNIMNPGKLCF